MRRIDKTRREFLKTMGQLAAAFVVPGCMNGGGKLSGGTSGKKPNVIIFFTDDQGTLDVNCYGSKDLHTPNLDALARRGTRFTQFYVGAPICSPSRAALLTGRCPQRAQLPSNAWGKRGLPPSQVTIAEMLKASGYRTAVFGKWHLGDYEDMSPLAQGFDEFFGHKRGCIDNYSHFFYWKGPNNHDLWRNDKEHWEDGKFFPDLIVREAHRYIEENRDHPFFMYLPFNMPHYPLQGQEKFRLMYADTKEPRKSYAAFISTLDEKIGSVIDKIDQQGLRDNTIIIFLSDHGHSVEERTNFGGGNAGPFRGHKTTLWEGGIRVPCIISWPGHIPENELRDQMAVSFDWMPTIAHYCRVDLPDRKLDGKNIASVIASPDNPSPHKILHWQYGRQWAVRQGKWKLIVNPLKGKNEKHPYEKILLSNMDKDITETKNLVGEDPEIVERLTKLHNNWTREVREQ